MVVALSAQKQAIVDNANRALAEIDEALADHPVTCVSRNGLYTTIDWHLSGADGGIVLQPWPAAEAASPVESAG